MVPNIEKTIKIGDILTSLTIIVSMIALLITWQQDRYLRQKEQADRVRNAAALTLAKLERLQTLYSSSYLELQPIFVETSEILTREDYDLVRARDFLWKQANETHNQVLGKIIEEEIEVAYTNLYAFHPSIREQFLSTIDLLEAEEKKIFNDFLEDSQSIILSFADKQEGYTTALLGNALRTTASEYQTRQDEKSKEILGPIYQDLLDLVLMTDTEITTLNAARQLLEETQ